jgi:phosphate transport system protein
MKILNAKKSQIETNLDQLFDAVGNAIEKAVDCLISRDFAACDRLIQNDPSINDLRRMIEQDCLVAIASQQPVAHDLRDIIADSHIASELERLGDYACDIAASVKRMDDASLDQLGMTNILAMTRLAREMLTLVMRANQEGDAQLARQISALDDKMDALFKETIDLVLAAMRGDPQLVTNGTCVLWIIHDMERYGDRTTNIAEQVVFRVESRSTNLG